MGPVVVVVDVGGDHLPGLVEGLELVAPDAALLEVAKPALDERLRLGIAVAAAAVRDAERADREPRGAGGECGAIVRAERERPRRDALLVESSVLSLVPRPHGITASAAWSDACSYTGLSRSDWHHGVA